MIGSFVNPSSGASGSSTPIGATLLKTNQIISYRTGDDGDLQYGRSASFLVLSANNPFGNTNRFTDITGGQTYSNGIALDWTTFNGTTVLGWRIIPATAANWNNAVDTALTYSNGIFTTGWRLPNIMEYISLIDWSQIINNKFNYPPFNIGVNSFWSSTTSPNNTANAYFVTSSVNIQVFTSAKTTAIPYLPVRVFTVSGTTIS